MSLVIHALGVRQRRRVLNAETPLLWNLMWPAAGSGREGQPDGTFYFGNQPNVLDQFLVNKNMAGDDSPISVRADTVRILRFPGMTDDGDYPKPVPFGGMGDPINQDGFSDHFPIGLTVIEAD